MAKYITYRYVYPTEIETFGSVSARQKNIASGPIGRAWAQNYTTAGRLPLHPSLGPSNTDFPPSSSLSDSERERILGSPLSHAALSFVHGGLAPTYPHLQPYPSAINTIAASLLHKLQTQSPLPPPYPPNPYPGLPDATPEEVKLYESDGPLWFRGWALESEQQVCKDVDGVLEQTGVRRMIMGHTPDFEVGCALSSCNLGDVYLHDNHLILIHRNIENCFEVWGQDYNNRHRSVSPPFTDYHTHIHIPSRDMPCLRWRPLSSLYRILLDASRWLGGNGGTRMGGTRNRESYL